MTTTCCTSKRRWRYWDSISEIESKDPFEKSLYARQMRLKEMVERAGRRGDRGHRARGQPRTDLSLREAGLVDISERLIADKKVSGEKAEKLRDLVRTNRFAELAMTLHVKVIHCSEKGYPDHQQSQEGQ
jgi:homospermidine synthase